MRNGAVNSRLDEAYLQALNAWRPPRLVLVLSGYHDGRGTRV